jgi:REP element-mobilizing transposase RayT
MVHVYARGNNKSDIFVDAFDREVYLHLLGQTVLRQRWRCLAYCLMPNHVHLLIETPQPNLADGMQRLHGPYAQGFNKRHARSGHLFQGRYGSVAVTDDVQLATTVGYIATNPVAAGFVAEPEAWPWSSHRALAGVDRPPPWLASARLAEVMAGAFGGDGAKRYAELVADRLSAPAAPALPSPRPTSGPAPAADRSSGTGSGPGSARRAS